MAPGPLQELQAWMKRVGIEHTDAIRLVEAAPGCSGLALGVVAARDVAEGDRLCTIPKAACLSIRTTQLADVIEAEQLGGGLGLVLAVMHEMSLGADSKWHGYFAGLPPREYLPLFWPADQLALLRGTELERGVESDRQAAAEDFEEHVLPLLERYPGRLKPEACTLHNFHVAASFVASRAFGVDDWHGDAMVPLADVFNHKASVVELGAGYSVHGADSSDEGSEGSSDSSGSDAGSDDGSDSSGGEGSDSGEEEVSGSGSSEAERSEGAGSAEQAALPRGSAHHGHHHHNGCCGTGHAHGDEHTHGRGPGHAAAASGGDRNALPAVTAAAEANIYGLTSANGLHLRLEMGIVDRDQDTLEVVAASAVPAGAEVHNTYGELGNGELVKKYGFALRQNPFTSVALDKRALLDGVRRALGGARWRARAALLREQTELLDDDEEPFEALPNGHISPGLFAALRVLCAPDGEAASWAGVADALRLPAAEAAGHRPPELAAVQVWRVLDAAGRPLAADAPQAAAAAGAAADGAADAASGAQPYAVLLSLPMCELLAGAVERRLGAYAAPLEEDLRRLEEDEQQLEQTPAGAPAAAGRRARGAASAGSGKGRRGAAGPSAAAGEQRAAERAALVLRVTEKEVLRDLQTALARRLAALPAEAQPAAEERKPRAGRRGSAAAGGAAAGKRKAAADGFGCSGRRSQRKL